MNGTEPENKNKTIRLEEASRLFPAYLKALDETGCITVPVSGTSMNPFLGHRRDTVTLVSAEGKKLGPGDIVLYKRSGSGLEAYIMHRIVGIKNGAYVLCGDAQTRREFGVDRKSILAVAIEAARKGKTIKNTSPVWLFYKHVWRILRPFRPALLRVFGKKRRASGKTHKGMRA